MDRYRYRTKVLVGPWRAAPDDAEEDALRAGQARRENEDGPLRWIVSGEIERANHRASEFPDADDELGGGGS